MPTGREPELNYRLFSTPFPGNDPNNGYVGWASAFPTAPGSSHPGQGQRPLQQGQDLRNHAGGFHNHFMIPGSAPPQRVQDENRMVEGEVDARHSVPENHSMPLLSCTFFRRTDGPLPQGQVRGVGPLRPSVASASAPNRNYSGSNGPNGSAQAQIGAGTSSGSIAPPQSLWASRFPFFFRSQPPPPPQFVPTIPENPTLVSYHMDPLTQSEGRNRFNEVQLFASEGRPVNSLGDGIVPVHHNNRGRQSPLDSSFPPITRYLIDDHCQGPFGVMPRHAFSPRHHVLRACDQCAPIPIELIFKSLDGVYKVNEGVYGEVYTGFFNGAHDESVYKLVPIEGAAEVNGEPQKRFHEIETEIRVSQRLNTLWNNGGRNRTEGFCNLYQARVLSGAYPQVLLQAWKNWHEENKSDNEIPWFGRNQLYVVFEYEHCGWDVESYNFRNAEQAYSVLLQVTFSLAVAELELEFEHRDLHWGNILVTRTNDPSIHYRLDGIGYQIPSNGLKTSIIDFTMARCNDEMGNPVFDDLQDDEIQFSGITDYQFEIYRKMRRINGNDWSQFHPRTNIYWLHYFVDKLLTKAAYVERTSTAHRTYRNIMLVFMNQILDYASCADYVKTQKQFVKPIGPPGSGRRF